MPTLTVHLTSTKPAKLDTSFYTFTSTWYSFVDGSKKEEHKKEEHTSNTACQEVTYTYLKLYKYLPTNTYGTDQYQN